MSAISIPPINMKVHYSIITVQHQQLLTKKNSRTPLIQPPSPPPPCIVVMKSRRALLVDYGCAFSDYIPQNQSSALSSLPYTIILLQQHHPPSLQTTTPLQLVNTPQYWAQYSRNGLNTVEMGSVRSIARKWAPYARAVALLIQRNRTPDRLLHY